MAGSPCARLFKGEHPANSPRVPSLPGCPKATHSTETQWIGPLLVLCLLPHLLSPLKFFEIFLAIGPVFGCFAIHMSANQFLPPTVRLSQAFESEKFSGGASGSEITRRSFIKRTGGATVATLVAWNMATQQARADGDNASDNSSGSYGMLCAGPAPEDANIELTSGQIQIPQAAGNPVPMIIDLNLTTSKVQDPSINQPYNYCGFMAAVSIKVSSTVGNGPKWTDYYVNYEINCDPENGIFTGIASNQSWLTRDVLITVGTTIVMVHFIIVDPFVFDPVFGDHSVDVNTHVRASYNVAPFGEEDPTIVATWGEDYKLVNHFVARRK